MDALAPEMPEPRGNEKASKSDLSECFRKLEELVERAGRGVHTTLQAEQTPDSGSECTHPPHESNASTQVEHIDRDVAWLESLYDGSGRLVSVVTLSNWHDFNNHQRDDMPPSSLKFRVCRAQNISNAHSALSREELLWILTGTRRIFWLPEYHEAKILLDKFVRHLEYYHHVCHLPSLPTVLERVYNSLSQPDDLKAGDAILLLSIFASSTHAWTQQDCNEYGLFCTPVEARSSSEQWIQGTEDLIDLARRTTRVSLEGIQGIVIAVFVPNNLEFFFRRSRYLLNTALMLARELGLHCIDLPSHADAANTAYAEMGRRLWWYLVSSEWFVHASFAMSYN